MSYIVTLSCNNPNNLHEIGFDPNYNYSVLGTGSAKDQDGKNNQILRIRNPWLSEEYQRAWDAQKGQFNIDESDPFCNWFSLDQVKQYFDSV